MAFDPEKITYFAKTDARGTQVPFGIKAKDRQRHMYVIGKTGMGKSTLLENMAAQDIMSGEGLAFIDPHGSTAEVLMEYIPEHRVNDVVYFAPFDMEHPIAFNVMEDVGADKRHLVVSGLMSTFKKIWVDAWSARMEYILTNTLLALIEYPDTTLLSVNRMLADKTYRDKVVDYCKDPAVKAYWTDEFANYTERFAAEALPAIQNKVGQFTGNPLIRNIIGQPKSSFDIRKMMDERKILIVNLSKGLVGETNADLLGSMITTRIYLAAMSRADLPVAQMKQMPNFYFFVDEFQSFANATFANILSEARKYHLNLIIAHQYIEQMEEDVRNAVFGNVGTTVTFRVGPYDAEHLEKLFEPRFMAQDLVNLGQYQIYLSLMIDGIGSQPFSAVTLPPVEPPPVSYRQMAIAASRKNFAHPRADVQEVVTKLHATERPPAGAKNGNGNGNGGKNNRNNNSNNNKKPAERAKPNFENTILEKLRAEQSEPPAKKPSESESSSPANKDTVEKPAEPTAEKPPAAEPAAEASKPEPTKPPESQSQPPRPAPEQPKAAEREQQSTPIQPAPDTSEPNLSALRNVLRRISDTERAKDEAKQKGGKQKEKRPRSGKDTEKRGKRNDERPREPRQSEQREKREPREHKPKGGNKANPDDLRSALAGLVNKEPAKEPTKEPSPPPEPPPQARESAPSSEPTPAPADTAQAPPASSDDISPKELERMMRVTSSDKPPI